VISLPTAFILLLLPEFLLKLLDCEFLLRLVHKQPSFTVDAPMPFVCLTSAWSGSSRSCKLRFQSSDTCCFTALDVLRTKGCSLRISLAARKW